MFQTLFVLLPTFVLKLNLMKSNLGNFDRVIRILIAVIIATLYSFNIITGTAAIVALILAAVFVLTGFVSFCPIYFVFGWSTKSKKE